MIVLKFLWAFFFVTMPLQIGLIMIGVVLLQQKIEMIRASR